MLNLNRGRHFYGSLAIIGLLALIAVATIADLSVTGGFRSIMSGFVGSFVGAGAAIFFAVGERNRVETKRRKAIATALKAEVLSNRAHIETQIDTPQFPFTYRFELIQSPIQYCEHVSPELLAALADFRVKLHLAEIGNAAYDKALERNQKDRSEMYARTSEGVDMREEIKESREQYKQMRENKQKQMQATFIQLTDLLPLLDAEGASLSFRVVPPYAYLPVRSEHYPVN